MVNNQPCPCGSKQTYEQCCQPFHNGKNAPTAEKLMRSRYTAFHFFLADYINKTWDPATLPKKLHLRDDTNWVRLKIVDTKTIDNNQASVHFIATYKENGKAFKLEENSLFKLKNGVWLYVNGIDQ